MLRVPAYAASKSVYIQAYACSSLRPAPSGPGWCLQLQALLHKPGEYCWRVCAANRGSAERAFSLSLAAGACVRVSFGHPAPQALLRAQLSTRVRDHMGKSFCSCEVGCLAKCPNPTQAVQLGGAGPWRFGWHFSLLGLRGLTLEAVAFRGFQLQRLWGIRVRIPKRVAVRFAPLCGETVGHVGFNAPVGSECE